MKYYMVENNWCINVSPEGWRNINSNWGKSAKIEELDRAKDILKYRSFLFRSIVPMRVVDDEGKIYCVYDPNFDTRILTSKYRLIEKEAYYLWEKAGRPNSDGKEFWFQAQLNLKESDGVFEVDGDYQW